ncbi:MAG TPA: GNAT family N-acetyltransferase [Acidimicrobiales bacterium]
MPLLAFEPLTGAALAAWLASTQEEYIAERVEGEDSEAEAVTNADASYHRLFPGGQPAEGQLVGRVIASEGPVGHLWVGPAGTDPSRWWVWDVAIEAAFRGRGYGRAAMELAEQLARAHRSATIGLNVFEHNHVARKLYTSLGYTAAAVVMRKDLR